MTQNRQHVMPAVLQILRNSHADVQDLPSFPQVLNDWRQRFEMRRNAGHSA